MDVSNHFFRAQSPIMAAIVSSGRHLCLSPTLEERLLRNQIKHCFIYMIYNIMTPISDVTQASSYPVGSGGAVQGPEVDRDNLRPTGMLNYNHIILYFHHEDLI